MTTLIQAIRVRREYDEARSAMHEAIARFELARQAYQELPLSFQAAPECPQPLAL